MEKKKTTEKRNKSKYCGLSLNTEVANKSNKLSITPSFLFAAWRVAADGPIGRALEFLRPFVHPSALELALGLWLWLGLPVAESGKR